MAELLASRVQHIGALADITPSHNILQIKPTGKDRKVRFVPISSPPPSRYKRPKHKLIIAEENYRKILESPDPNALLSAVNLSIFAEFPNAPPSPNMSKRRDKSASSPRAATPTNPPVAQLGGAQLFAINESGDTVLNMAAPATPLSYKGSPLNKPLPSKPTDRADISPERPGLLDATEKDNSLPKHPVLQPNFSGGESPGSFKVTSSLDSTPSSLAVEFGTGVVVEGQMVSSITGLDFESAKSLNAVTLRAPPNNSSPVHRVKGLSSMPSNSSLNRRQARAGVGFTIRKSADAHELIMGVSDPNGSPHPPRTSSLPQARKSSLPLAVKSFDHLTTAASRLSHPTAASAARAADSKKPTLTPGKNFLSRATASKASMIPTPNKSVANNTPSNKTNRSVSDSSTSLRKSTTVNSIKKGLKSRFSEIFSSHRRTISSSSISNHKGYAAIVDVEEDIVLEADFDSPQSTPAVYKVSSKPLTAQPANVPNAKSISTDHIRGEKKTPSAGVLVDREHSAKEQQRHIRDEYRTNRMAERLASRTPAPARGVNRPRHGGDEPPSPPPTRDGPAGHYAEGEVRQEDGNGVSEEELDRYLEAQLNAAEDYLRDAVDAANVDPNDPAAGERVEAVIRALGESIIAARTAHIAGIRLRVATSNLIQSTTQRAATARGAIVAARGRVIDADSV